MTAPAMGYTVEAFDTLQFFGPEAWRHRDDCLIRELKDALWGAVRRFPSVQS